MLTFMLCLSGSIFFLRYAVGYFGIQYPELSTVSSGSAVEGLTWFEELVNSLIHTLQTFGMGEDYAGYIISGKTMICALYGANTLLEPLYGAYASILNFIAPLAACAVVLELLASIFPKLRLWLSTGRETYYFSELNEASLALAGSIVRNRADSIVLPVLVFTNVYSNDEMTSELSAAARLLGAICIKDDLSLVRISKRGKKKFFLMDEVEAENLKALTAVAEPGSAYIKKSEIYLFVNSDSYVQLERNIRRGLIAKGMPADDLPVIIPVRCYRNLAANLLCDVPLFEPLIGKPGNPDGTVDLTVTILGAGDIGIEMFLSTYWFGQIRNCNLKINVVSRETEEAFWGKIDYINPEIRRTTIKGDPILRINRKGDMADVYCQVSYASLDVKSPEFIDRLHQREDSILNTDYFFVCLGSDEDNISVANTVKTYMGAYHLSPAYSAQKQARGDCAGPDTVITYVVYDTALATVLNAEKHFRSDGKIADIYMCAVGSLEDVYSEQNITMSDYTLFASKLNRAYKGVQKRSRTRSDLSDAIRNRYKDDYKYWANLARAMHVRYKLFSIGMLTQSGLDGHTSGGESLDELYHRFREIATAGEPKLLHEMAWLEHRRWNAFTRVKGFRHTSDYQAYAIANQSGSYKQMDLGLHPCLVECDKNGIRAEMKDGRVVKETLWKKADDPNLDLLDELSYDLYASGYNGYDLKEYDYPLEDLQSVK